jgi:hypothetical protein
MTDEIRLSNDLVFDEFTSSVGNKILVAHWRGNVLMTAKQIAIGFAVSVVGG